MKRNVIFAAGGTGGHIYPAVAIAENLLEKNPELNIIFVGTRRGLENSIIPEKGFTLLHLPIGRLNHNVALSERILTVLQMPVAMLLAVWYCLRYRPVFLLGAGGHASGPMLLVASLLGFPTVIWEPNALPGLANRILAKFCSQAWAVFENAKLQLGPRAHLSGYPLRKAIESVAGRAGETSEPGKLNILVYGGSLGAQGINQAMIELLKNHPDLLERVNIYHQAGRKKIEECAESYRAMGLLDHPGLSVVGFITDMEKKYLWANLVVCRSGAGTMTEVAAVGAAGVFIPLPNAAENHQQKNAEAFVMKNAGTMILQKDLSGATLKVAIEKYLNNSEFLNSTKLAAHSFYQPQSAGKMTDILIKDYMK